MNRAFWAIRIVGALLLIATPARSQYRWPSPDAATLEPGTSIDAPLCRDSAPLLTTDSLGPAAADIALAEFQSRCPHVRLGWVWKEGSANPIPAAAVRFGPATITLEFSDTLPDSRAYHITVADSAVRTGNGLGPGSSLSQLIAQFGQATYGTESCQLWAKFDSAPGLSWVFGSVEEEVCQLFRSTAPLSDDLANALRVKWVILFERGR